MCSSSDGSFADDVHAQNLARFAMKDELQPPGGIAADLPARGLAIVGHADFVGHVFLGQLLFGLAGEGDLREWCRCRKDRWPGWTGSSVPARSPRRCGPAPWRRKPGSGNPMTSPAAKMFGTLVRYSASTAMRPRLSASRPAAARFSSSTLPWRPTAYSRASPSDPLVAFQIRDDAAVRHLFHAGDFFIQAHGDAMVAQVVGERLDDFARRRIPAGADAFRPG